MYMTPCVAPLSVPLIPTLICISPTYPLFPPPYLHIRLDGLQALDLLVLGHALGVQRGQLAAHARVLLEQGAAQGLGRVRGEDEIHLLVTQLLRRGGGRGGGERGGGWVGDLHACVRKGGKRVHGGKGAGAGAKGRKSGLGAKGGRAGAEDQGCAYSTL